MIHGNWALWLRVLLYLHITAGGIAFVCAPVALLTKKGGQNHRQWGKVYFWGMATVAVTAITLSFALPIFFLAMVAVFSFYASFAAYRVLYLKDMYKGQKPQLVDWLAAIITIASSALLCACGFLYPRQMGVGIIEIAGHQISIVSVVFGFLGMRLGGISLRQFLKPPTQRMFWWFSHDRQLHRRHDRLLRRQPRPLVRSSLVGLALAHHPRRPHHRHLVQLLRKEVHPKTAPRPSRLESPTSAPARPLTSPAPNSAAPHPPDQTAHPRKSQADPHHSDPWSRSAPHSSEQTPYTLEA